MVNKFWRSVDVMSSRRIRARYVFRDYTDGATLHKTKIPIKDDDPREVPIRVEDIKQLIHDQIGRIQVLSIGAFLSL
jgi:hypothetical protein